MPEREVKLAASPGFRLPSFELDGTVATELEAQHLSTTYFDTPDLRLARWGCSLRYRDGQGWTVKLPSEVDGPLLVRDEHEFAGDPKPPPAEAVDLVRAYVRGAELAPVTRLRTLRRRVRLVAPENEEMAEVVDDEVSVLDGRRIAARFRELEVEITPSTPDGLLDSVLEQLRAAGAGAPDPTPKYVRAVGPRATEPPEVAVRDLPAGATAGEVVRQAIARSVVRLIRHDAIVRLGTDPEGVHQARVATRRLRSDLRTFGSLIDPVWRDDLRMELRWIGGCFGAARDADVLLDRMQRRVESLGSAASAARRLLERLEANRKHEHADLLVALRQPRYTELLDRLVAAAQRPALLLEADLPAASVLPGLVRDPWDRLAKLVKQLDPSPTDEQLHAVRIQTKRVRYAAEAVSPLMGKPARAFAEAAAALQEVLGEHNDAVNAERWLRESGSKSRAPQTAFAAGELAGLERSAAAAARARWPKAWRALADRRLRAWM